MDINLADNQIYISRDLIYGISSAWIAPPIPSYWERFCINFVSAKISLAKDISTIISLTKDISSKISHKRYPMNLNKMCPWTTWRQHGMWKIKYFGAFACISYLFFNFLFWLDYLRKFEISSIKEFLCLAARLVPDSVVLWPSLRRDQML